MKKVSVKQPKPVVEQLGAQTSKVTTKVKKNGVSLTIKCSPDGANSGKKSNAPLVTITVSKVDSYPTAFKSIEALYRNGIKSINVIDFKLMDKNVVTAVGRNKQKPTIRGFAFNDAIASGDSNARLEAVAKYAGTKL